VIGTVSGILLDTSCRHAALARILQRLSPAADPRLALGNTADTRAEVAGDRVAFVDLLPGFAATLRAHGFELRWHDLTDQADWRDALAALAGGRSVIVDADTFHQPHYWRNYRRFHALHSVALEDLDPDTATIHMVDAVSESFFADRVRLSELEPALFSGHGQTWWELRAIGGAPEFDVDGLRRHLADRAAELTRGGRPGYLSGERLAAFIVEHLDDYVGAARRPAGRGGQAAERARAASNVMWNYSHTLRWFAHFLTALGELGGWPPAAKSAEHIAASAHDWLVARNTVMRIAVDDASRAARFNEQIAHRLRCAVEQLRRGTTAIEELRSLV
jgi:hypothetical protein